ncbi:MAG: hypothetical protein ABJA10_09310 [Aestuariivirga sp.]
MLVAISLLAGCSANNLLLAKPGPQPVAQDSLIHPPWETLVKAGPGAENDIDLETLNGPQAAAPEDTVAVSQPAVAPLAQASPHAIAASPQPSPPSQTAKPGAIAIKAVAVIGVDGASPQANRELTAAMRKVLADAGWPVLSATRRDALSIRGHVVLDPAQATSQSVHLSWQVASPKGKVLGSVDQNNQVPAHSLDGSWGETAQFAAQAAAEGLFKLIGQYR